MFGFVINSRRNCACVYQIHLTSYVFGQNIIIFFVINDALAQDVGEQVIVIVMVITIAKIVVWIFNRIEFVFLFCIKE